MPQWTVRNAGTHLSRAPTRGSLRSPPSSPSPASRPSTSGRPNTVSSLCRPKGNRRTWSPLNAAFRRSLTSGSSTGRSTMSDDPRDILGAAGVECAELDTFLCGRDPSEWEDDDELDAAYIALATRLAAI